MKTILKLYNHFVNDSLYKNSVYLILSTLITAVLGYFFWIINARLFSPSEVGIGTTLISSMTLLSSFCLLGLGGSLVKYLPTSNNKTEKINTAITIIAITSIIVSIIYIIFLNRFSPKLLFIKENIFFLLAFVFFVAFDSLNTISQHIFVAYRAAIYVLFKNTMLSILKLVFAFSFTFLGAYGVFASVGLATTIAFLVSMFFLISQFGYTFKPSINKEIVKTIFRFSVANYVMGIVSGLPASILPIFITNSIGPEYAAYYYMDMMIAGFLYIIPMATSQSLFAEGSFSDKELSILLKKAVIIICVLLLPASLGVILFGKFVLTTFGSSYWTEGLTLLRLLTLSSLFISINYIGNAILYVKHHIKKALILNFISTSIILTLSFFLTNKGLYGVGLAWLIGNGVISLYFLPSFLPKKLRTL